MWFASGIAQRKITEQHAWHAAMFGDVLGAGHQHGGDAMLLQITRHEADGLVAHRAVGHQHRGIDADDDLVDAIFDAAKQSDRILSNEEVHALVTAHG